MNWCICIHSYLPVFSHIENSVQRWLAFLVPQTKPNKWQKVAERKCESHITILCTTGHVQIHGSRDYCRYFYFTWLIFSSCCTVVLTNRFTTDTQLGTSIMAATVILLGAHWFGLWCSLLYLYWLGLCATLTITELIKWIIHIATPKER